MARRTRVSPYNKRSKKEAPQKEATEVDYSSVSCNSNQTSMFDISSVTQKVENLQIGPLSIPNYSMKPEKRETKTSSLASISEAYVYGTNSTAHHASSHWDDHSHFKPDDKTDILFKLPKPAECLHKHIDPIKSTVGVSSLHDKLASFIDERKDISEKKDDPSLFPLGSFRMEKDGFLRSYDILTNEQLQFLKRNEEEDEILIVIDDGDHDEDSFDEAIFDPKIWVKKPISIQPFWMKDQESESSSKCSQNMDDSFEKDVL